MSLCMFMANFWKALFLQLVRASLIIYIPIKDSLYTRFTLEHCARSVKFEIPHVRRSLIVKARGSRGSSTSCYKWWPYYSRVLPQHIWDTTLFPTHNECCFKPLFLFCFLTLWRHSVVGNIFCCLAAKALLSETRSSLYETRRYPPFITTAPIPFQPRPQPSGTILYSYSITP